MESNSIDKSVREVVKAHVEEVVTEMVDTKVQETVVNMQDELTKEKLIDLLSGDAIKEVVSNTDFEGSISAGDIDTESVAEVVSDSLSFATEDYVDNVVAEHEHEHESYDIWNQIDSYVYEAIEEKISEHVHETSHAAHGGGAGPISKSQLQSLLNIIGVNASFDDNKLISMSTKDSHFGAWPMVPAGGIAARLVKLEKQAAVANVLGNGNIAADPRVDQLMAWAKHVDNILKAAAESTVLNQEVPA